MEQEKSFELFPEADQQFTEELMMQEELMLLQSGESDIASAAPVADSTVTDPVSKTDLVPAATEDLAEPIEDADDVIVEPSAPAFNLSAIFANPKVKWVLMALIAIFVIWLITSGVLWAILKWIFQVVVGLITLAVIIYIIKEWIL